MVLNLEPNDQDKTGYVSMKHTRTEVDGGDDTEHLRNKRAKKNDSEDSCFVALVTASNLQKDTLYLPKDFSSSNGLGKECREIIVTDGWEREWALDLRFNESLDSFYISRGWRSLCNENGKKAGGLFVFKLMGHGETPLLSFSPTESRGERPSKKESYPAEPCNGKRMNKEKIEKSYLRCGDSTQPSQNQFVTLTFTHDTESNGRQYLPLSFLKENGLDKPRMITLLGKDDAKWLVNLRRPDARRLCLGKGWKEFARANGLKIGKSFTLESIWENGTPILRLFDTGSTSSRRQQGEHCSKAREKEHVSTEPNSGKKVCRGEVQKNHLRCRNSTSPSLNRLMTLRVAPDSFRKCRQYLRLSFMRENGLDKPGMITLIGKDGTKWMANCCQEACGTMYLGKGWRDFAKANDLKIGESFTLEAIWKGATPMLSLFRTESTCDPRQQGQCSKDSEEKSIPTEPSSGNKTTKGMNNREGTTSRKPNTKESFPPIQNSFVTLTLEPEDVEACKLDLPSQFMRANGIDKLGKITLLGKDGMTYSAFRLSRDGFMAVGIDWKNFCETNGVHTGESFTLEFTKEQDAVPVLKFRSNGEA